MTEKTNGEIFPAKPELTPSQLALKELADEILALRPEGYKANLIQFPVNLPPEDVEQKLKKLSISDLLLKDGDSLSADPPNRYWGDLDLYVGKAQVIQSDVRTWGWDYDIGGNSIKPGEDSREVGSWGRQIDIRLWYSSEEQEAAQKVSVQTWSYTGELPEVVRDVTAPAYAEMGYEGHNQKIRDAKNDEEVLEFIELARELFEARVQ
jgi:hypothetical protein